jgi:twitching motility two-component system response regulator PilG
MQRQYQAQQLISLLESIQNKGGSGTFRISATIDPSPSPRTCILVCQGGKITYGGYTLPDLVALAKKLIKKFKPGVSDRAATFARDTAKNPASAREIFRLLCKIRILTWEQIEYYVQTQTASILEQFLPHPGQIEFTPTVEFDLSYGEDLHGLDWAKIKQDLVRRKEEWATFRPAIPSIEAIPRFSPIKLEEITDANVRQHLQQWVDGKRSLAEIAQKLDRDPLELARTYLTWAETDWVSFSNSAKTPVAEAKQATTGTLSTILSVDDSPIVQASIKKALADRCNLLLASNAVDALNILNSKQVDLLLLDVTMPDIDGLEMCKTLRSIPKFRNLPIVMVTARDTLVDKMKGQIAGMNRYLTKPFDTEKLLAVIWEFVGKGLAVDEEV